MADNTKLTDVRCTNCNKKLLAAKIKEGTIEVLCPCGTMNKLIINKKPENRQAEKVNQ